MCIGQFPPRKFAPDPNPYPNANPNPNWWGQFSSVIVVRTPYMLMN